jgi:hypothetical protein
MSDERYVKCDACGMNTRCVPHMDLPVGGWVLPIDSFGYYGGYTDHVEPFFGGPPSRQVVMCRGCIRWFLALFPRLYNLVHEDNKPEEVF